MNCKHKFHFIRIEQVGGFSGRLRTQGEKHNEEIISICEKCGLKKIKIINNKELTE